MFSTGPQGHNSQPARAKQNGTWSTLQLSSGISANILDFGMPQKHVLKDKMTIAARSVEGEPGPIRSADPNIAPAADIAPIPRAESKTL